MSSRGVCSRHGSGYVIVIIVVALTVLMAVGLSTLRFISSGYGYARHGIRIDQAQYAAEAGIAYTLAELATNNSYAGVTSPYTVYSGVNGSATVTTQVQNGASDTKKITATGLVYAQPIAVPSPIVSRRVVEVQIEKDNTVGLADTKIFAGYGGVKLVFTGNVMKSIYSLGSVDVGSAQVGSDAHPVKVWAANRGCGTSTTYPQQCAAGTNPVTIDALGAIYGTVCARHQTGWQNIYTGTVNPGLGLIPNCVPTLYDMPTFDKAAFTATKTIAVTPADAGCVTGIPFFRPAISARTWSAGTRINGTFNHTEVLDCSITIAGDVYIRGDFTMKNVYQLNLIVPEAVGCTPPTIVVNGIVDFSTRTNVVVNSCGTGLRIISFASSNSTCANSDTCAAITNQQLYNTKNIETVGCGGSGFNPTLPGTLLWSYFGKVSIKFGCNANGVIGQAIEVGGFGLINDTSYALSEVSSQSRYVPVSWKIVY